MRTARPLSSACYIIQQQQEDTKNSVDGITLVPIYLNPAGSKIFASLAIQSYTRTQDRPGVCSHGNFMHAKLHMNTKYFAMSYLASLALMTVDKSPTGS